MVLSFAFVLGIILACAFIRLVRSKTTLLEAIIAFSQAFFVFLHWSTKLCPFLTCKSGKQHKTCASALCTMDDASYFLVIRLGPQTSECEKNVTVVSTVTSCDVTNCATTLHGFNKHAASRREVSDSRGVPRCTEKNHKIYACSRVSIIRLVQSTVGSACNSFPSCQLPSELVSVRSIVPSQRFRPDVARVHIGLDR